MHSTGIKTLPLVKALLLALALITLVGCGVAKQRQAQQQAIELEFANAVAEHEKNPLSAIARYEELLRTAVFSEKFANSSDTDIQIQQPKTGNTVIAPYSAVAAELHYNLHNAYLSLYHEMATSVALRNSANAKNKAETSQRTTAIETHPKNLNDAYYFAKAIWHLEQAIVLPNGNLPNKAVLVKLANETRKENDRSTKTSIDESSFHHKSRLAGKFAIIFFNLLLVFAILTLVGKLMPHWKNLSGKPDFFFKTIAKTIDFFTTHKNKESAGVDKESAKIGDDNAGEVHTKSSKISDKYIVRISLLLVLVFCYISSMTTLVIDLQRGRSVSAITVSNNTALLKSPDNDAIKVFTLPSGEKAQLLRNQGQWYYVRVLLSKNATTREIRGWINENQLLKL